MIPPLETHHTGNQDLELFQQNVKKWAKVLEDNPMLAGHRVKDITFDGAADSTFNHKLDRMPLGWIPVRVRPAAGAGVAVSFGESAATVHSFTLFASAACTADFWVF